MYSLLHRVFLSSVNVDFASLTLLIAACAYAYSAGAESECSCWILRENHFGLIAVGSESLLRVNLTQRGVRAKLLSHDELVGSYGNACKLGWLLAIYLSCESEINRFGSPMQPLNSNEFHGYTCALLLVCRGCFSLKTCCYAFNKAGAVHPTIFPSHPSAAKGS